MLSLKRSQRNHLGGLAMSYKITVLGSGTSTGIPMPGCNCSVCTSQDQKDKRLRSSLFLETEKKKVLIDCTPDLRTQLLAHNITDIDGVFITHDHADHVHGIDDLRPICYANNHKTIPIASSRTTATSLRQRFPYIFDVKLPIIGGGIPLLTLTEIPLMKRAEIWGESFTFFNLPHGRIASTGFLYHDPQGKNLAYLIDCHDVPQDVISFLQEHELEFLFLDCVREKPHATHLHLEKSLEVAQKIRAKATYFIHMAHQLSHQKTSDYLKQQGHQSIFLAFDGLKLNS